VAKFTVLTPNDRNLVIEADRFEPNNTDYVFLKDGSVVGSIPRSPSVFAVVNQEAEKADFYFADHQDDDTYAPPVCECTPEFDDETDDVCLDCRFEEFLESQEFYNAVADIIVDVLGLDIDGEPEGAEVTD
jgi:hypothetical protein